MKSKISEASHCALSKLPFSRRVLHAVANIPAGKTMTYGEVAKLVGVPCAARAVGNVLKRNFDPCVPCHRVIKADGACGGYNRGQAKKQLLLRGEGAECI